MSKKLEAASCLSVVIPAYNEEATLANVVGEVLKLPHVLEVIVVDDGSTDGTRQICEELSLVPKVRTVRIARNKGKCEALKAGFALSRGEIVIVQDADLEYDPNEIPEVIQPILDGRADVVYGSRFLVRKSARVLYFYHYLANKGLTLFSNLLTNLSTSRMLETGYKAFRGDIVRNMLITSQEVRDQEIELTAKVAKLGLLYLRSADQLSRKNLWSREKKIGLSDGVMAVWYIVKFNLFCNLQSSFAKPPDIPLPKTVK